MSDEREAQRLLDRLSDGAFSPEDAARLNELLSADPAYLDSYLEHMELDALLGWQFGRTAHSAPNLEVAVGKLSGLDELAGLDVLSSLDEPADLKAPSSRRAPAELPQITLRSATQTLAYLALGGPVRTADRWSTAAMLLTSYLVFYGAFFSLMWSMRPQPIGLNPLQREQFAQLAAEDRAKGVATLVEAQDCLWDEGRAPASVGGRVTTAHSLRLRSGQALLRFDGGAEVGLVGPVVARAVSAAYMRLEQGRLAAHVPPHAFGFTVETASARLVDLGTDFSVEVSEKGDTEMTVTRGAVKVVQLAQVDGQPLPGDASLRVTAGQSVTVWQQGRRLAVNRSAMPPEWIKQLKLTDETPAAVIAYQTINEAPGNNSNFIWTVGLDFDVARPIRIEALGVFDDFSNGISPQSKLTVQLWLRDNRGTPEDRTDDVGVETLAEQTFDHSSQGVLLAGHRFKPLASPLELAAGSYCIVAHGFRPEDRFADFKWPERGPLPSPRAMETWRGSIVHVGSRWGQRPGEFPNTLDKQPYCYVAGSFKFSPRDFAPAANPNTK